MFVEFNIFERIHCNLISNKENEMIPTIYNKISFNAKLIHLIHR